MLEDIEGETQDTVTSAYTYTVYVPLRSLEFSTFLILVHWSNKAFCQDCKVQNWKILWNYLANLIECIVCDKWTNVLKVVQMVLAEASHYASVFLFTNPYKQKCPLCSKTQDKGKHPTLTPNKVLWKDWNWKTVSWHGTISGVLFLHITPLYFWF